MTWRWGIPPVAPQPLHRESPRSHVVLQDPQVIWMWPGTGVPLILSVSPQVGHAVTVPPRER